MFVLAGKHKNELVVRHLNLFRHRVFVSIGTVTRLSWVHEVSVFKWR